MVSSGAEVHFLLGGVQLGLWPEFISWPCGRGALGSTEKEAAGRAGVRCLLLACAVCDASWTSRDRVQGASGGRVVWAWWDLVTTCNGIGSEVQAWALLWLGHGEGERVTVRRGQQGQGTWGEGLTGRGPALPGARTQGSDDGTGLCTRGLSMSFSGGAQQMGVWRGGVRVRRGAGDGGGFHFNF